MNKNSKILIIGFGSIGKRHYRNIISLGYKNVSVFDKAAEVFKDFPAITRLSKIFPKTLADFEVVFVCTPASSHISWAKEAVSAGCHVFIEKPLSVSLSGADALLNLAKQKRVKVMVASNYIFNEGFRKLRQALDDGKYGKAVMSYVHVGYYLPDARKGVDFRKNYASRNKDGGGVVIDSGSHVLGYLKKLFGDPEAISGFKSRSNILGIDSEEAVSIIIKHKSGVVATVALDFLSKESVHLIEVMTSKGILKLNIIEDQLFFEDDKKRTTLYMGDKNINQMFIEEIKYFFECVRKGENPIKGIKDAKDTLAVLLNLKKHL